MHANSPACKSEFSRRQVIGDIERTRRPMLLGPPYLEYVHLVTVPLGYWPGMTTGKDLFSQQPLCLCRSRRLGSDCHFTHRLGVARRTGGTRIIQTKPVSVSRTPTQFRHNTWHCNRPQTHSKSCHQVFVVLMAHRATQDNALAIQIDR